ncbi:glycoside hydrolase family 97 protein [Puteibacter caeruleilacunae]|nr:glycoside hydrolase family 97 protein [Puteibacter caeruleilacunae]
MKKIIIGVILILTGASLGFCKNKNQYTMKSPNSQIEAVLSNENGLLSYQVFNNGKEILLSSRLGLEFIGEFDLSKGLKVVEVEKSKYDEQWEQPWGETQKVRNHYTQYLYEVKNENYKLNVYFRLFNNGVAFRYEIPKQEGVGSFKMSNELTEFKLAKGDKAWWIPAYDKNSYEHLYKKTSVEQLVDTVHTPLTVELKNGGLVSIHEANLTNYASMCLAPDHQGGLECDLAPWPNGIKVVGKAPFKSPWRTIQIGENAGDLVTNYMILNLNPPCKIKDTSWIKPAKYVGVWWEMHMKKSTWKQGEKHGATTENVKRYIDFASKYGFAGVLAEGWNYGWDGAWYKDGSNFIFDKPVPDFDMTELSKYAKDKGVQIISHHETGGDVANYEDQVEKAFQYCRSNNIDAIKTGHVGQYLNGKHTHYGQFAVNYYRRIVKLAAKYQICLDVHEPIKDTGIRRTWPNMMTREGARGMEFDAWSKDGGNPPEHLTVVPFTRCLAGPFDFTPGIFEMTLPTRPKNQSNMTLAKQLATYILIYSPMHMAADLPENYEGNPALQFILDVPVDWADTKVLDAKLGDRYTVVRKDRNSEDWYLGCATDEEKRTFSQKLSFLDAGAKYVAEVYRDGADAHWKENPKAITIEKIDVTSKSTLKYDLAAGGGLAIRFKKVQ